MTKYESFLDHAWNDYLHEIPLAKKVVDLLVSEGECVVNDHIAFRTLDHPQIGLESLKNYFEEMGLEKRGEYYFEAKKVRAYHFEHPERDDLPKVFCSELLWKNFSEEFQDIILTIFSQLGANNVDTLMAKKKVWALTYDQYQRLSEESEYGGWFASLGLLPNHFTVSVNHLKKYDTISKLNDFLKGKEILLNASGGEVKGSQGDYLEQSSTMADKKKVSFLDGEFEVPTCYVEFAYRYPLDNGKLFQGFVEKSADKIFESTHE